MEAGATAKLRITGSKDDAMAAIREALPDDTIVRDQDDGVGRFAGERVVMLIGTGADRLMMSRGNWRLMKTLEDAPQLEITFRTTAAGCTVSMKAAEAEKTTAGSLLWSTLTNALTVAALIVAYHMFQDLELEPARVAGLSLGAGVFWTAAAHYWPRKRDDGLDKAVRAALRPMLREKKKKKKKKDKKKSEDKAASE